MEEIARRKFCGMTILSLPLLCINAKGAIEPENPSDPILDIIADELARIAADGAQEGFKAEHFRRSAALIRTLDARLEEKGANRRINRQLQKNDFHKIKPSFMARNAVNYWRKHGVHLNEEDLRTQLSMDSFAYREMKKAIRKHGGIRMLHAAVAQALEQKAKEPGLVSSQGGAVIKNGVVSFTSSKALRANFMKVQFEDLPFDPTMFLGSSFDCM
jgi:hypothetical protein